jgi:DNA excision repair protein ERCC-4
VLVVNATQEEESELGEELSLMGCRKPGLRIVGYETGTSKDRSVFQQVQWFSPLMSSRQDLYKTGGIISITSRILVVDMLQNDIPVDRITGLIVLHAERWVYPWFCGARRSFTRYRVSPTHIVSFIARLYREKNSTGFLKAFTDQPEHITSGISPLKAIMKELHLRRVSIWPRSVFF